MKKLESRILLSVLLIVAGVLFLLQNLGLLIIGDIVWPILFAGAGLIFLFVFLNQPDTNWWAIIPGLVLLSLAATVALDALGADAWSGAVFLGGIGLAFWVVYLTHREHWWAVIPGGVMLTLAMVAGLDSVPGFEGVEMGGVFFLGLGLTFGLLAFLPTQEGRMRWPLIPAAALLAFGVLTMAAAVEIIKYIWPLALILAGLYLIFRIITSQPDAPERKESE